MTTSTVNMVVTLGDASDRLRRCSRRLPVFLGVGYCALGAAGALTVPARWTVALLLTCAVAFAICAATAIRRHMDLSTSSVVLWALVFRSPFVLAQPALSDDVWRYLWDGHVAVAGINPYSYAPDAPELVAYRNEVWPQVNHRSIPTVYPPFAQALFHVAAAHGGFVAWKLMCLAFDLVVIASLAVALRRRPDGAARLLLYAWNPLVIVEFTWSGHVDAAAVAFCTLAVVTAQKHHHRVALALATVAAGIKLFPAVLLPSLMRRTRTRSAAWVIPLAIATAGLTPYVRSGTAAWLGGLREYARSWEFNSLPYSILTARVPSALHARCILGAALVAAVWAVTVRRRRPEDVAVGALAACTVLSPTVHPWYVTWALPAAILSDRPPRLASLAATLAVLLAYWVLVIRETTGEWWLPRPWLAIEWGVVVMVSVGEWLAYSRSSTCGGSTRCGSATHCPDEADRP